MGYTVSILLRRCFGIFQLEEMKVLSTPVMVTNGAIKIIDFLEASSPRRAFEKIYVNGPVLSWYWSYCPLRRLQDNE
jgi:hypothetical protein